jgi:hypothetical protein
MEKTIIQSIKVEKTLNENINLRNTHMIVLETVGNQNKEGTALNWLISQ